MSQPSRDEGAPQGGIAPARAGRRGRLLRAIVLTSFLLLVAWAGTKVNWRAIGEQFANASLPYLSGMLAAWVASLFVRPLRLALLLSSAVADPAQARYWPAFRADNIAMAINSIVPARAGEVAMAVALNQSLGISTASSSSLVLVDRFLDFCTVVLLFVAGFLLSPGGSNWARHTTTLLAGLVVVFVVGLILTVRLRRLWIRQLIRLFTRLDPTRADKWDTRIRDLFAVLAVIDDVPRMAALIALSAATWLIISLSYWFGLHSFWPEVSFGAAAFAASAVALSFLLPISLAGIGLFQGAAILALQLFGASTSVALAFGILAHALQVGAILIVAAISVAWRGFGYRLWTDMRAVQRPR